MKFILDQAGPGHRGETAPDVPLPLQLDSPGGARTWKGKVLPDICYQILLYEL